MLDVHIVDGAFGTKDRAGVVARALCVAPIERPQPQIGASSKYRFFSQLFSSNGDGTGTTNMNVDGSSTAQEFTIDSTGDFDIRIQQLIIYIEDTVVANKTFGNVAALSTGWDLKIQEAGVETSFIEKAQTNGEVFIQTNTPIFGTDVNKWNIIGEADAATNQGTFVIFNLANLVPAGVRIGRSTNDRAISVVNDDLTGLTEFVVRAMGYRHFE